MKRFFAFLFCILQIGCLFSLPGHCEGKSFSWYCKHVEGNVQPPLDPSLKFVENYNSFYADTRHSRQSDSEKVVYFTFDAGYENGNVSKILDILEEEHVPAAFFVLGHLITGETDLVKRMAENGHLVCNHTVRHKNMTSFDDAAFAKELQELEGMYREKIGGELARYYRPPQGVFNERNLKNAQELGYATVFWSFAYPDWDNDHQMPPEKAYQMIMNNLHNGEVMLLHPTSSTNAIILRDVIQAIRRQGYRFGTLDELTCRGEG